LVKKNHVIFFAVTVGLVIFGFYYSMDNNTLFTPISKQFSPVNWDEVKPRFTVINSIPIVVLEENGFECTMQANNLDKILDHEEFERSGEAESALKYERDTHTINLSCSEIPEEKSRLTIKYVTRDSPEHPEKWEYYIESYDETSP